VSSYEKPSLTLDEVLDEARTILEVGADNATLSAGRLAKGIIDLLGEAQPCGLEPPSVFRASDPPRVIVEAMDSLDLGEARAFAAMILRACDEGDVTPDPGWLRDRRG